MKVKDKEKLNNPLKGWRILSAISSMVFSHSALGKTEFFGDSRASGSQGHRFS